MPLTLDVDDQRWTEHLERTVSRHPRIVPVVKGNAYGFGMATLAGRAESLGADTIAVGLYDELLQVIEHFSGDLMVMTPWRPGGELPPMDDTQADRVIHTVSRLADLDVLAASDGPGRQRPRVVIELGTSMRRHGLVAEELSEAAGLLTGLQVEGLTLHLPLVPPGSSDAAAYVREVETCLEQAGDAGLPTHRLFVSHLSSEEMSALAERHPSVDWRPRVGTSLWVDDQRFLRQRATVVDVHEVVMGDRTGYNQLRIPAAGHLAVVAGGSSNGVQPEPPQGVTGDAGRWLSPFRIGGDQCWLAEPPHMQASSLYFPAGDRVPCAGDEVTVQLDLTAAVFDRVHFT